MVVIIRVAATDATTAIFHKSHEHVANVAEIYILAVFEPIVQLRLVIALYAGSRVYVVR